MTTTLRPFWQWLLWPLLVLAMAAQAADGDPQPVPALKAPVTDLAKLLPPDRAEFLSRQLQLFSQQHGSQIAVLIVPSTAPEPIFDYSFRVAESWKLGRKGVDDGVLLVIAVNDRKTHIQVGYGLEGAIPDAIAKRVLQETLRPHFRQGDYAGGIEATTQQLEGLILGESLPPAAETSTTYEDHPLLPLALGILVAGFVIRAIFGRLVGGVSAGIALGLFFWLVIGLPMLFVILATVFSTIFVAAADPARILSGGYGGGGFGSGGLGGGFGGGGGGFGGGGASGDW